jgi:hypothetical protein
VTDGATNIGSLQTKLLALNPHVTLLLLVLFEVNGTSIVLVVEFLYDNVTTALPVQLSSKHTRESYQLITMTTINIIACLCLTT